MSDGPGPFAGPVRHVYVHVPFCRERCDYCDFASTAVGPAAGRRDTTVDEGRARLLDGYVAAVAAEWEREAAAHDVRRLETLYLGGGTPSLLGPERLERLLEPFRPFLTPAAEVTVETNPEDVDEAYCALGGHDAGGRRGATGRASAAGATARSSRAARLARRAELRPAAAGRARAPRRRRSGRRRPPPSRAGVTNLSIDLMHGIPGQTREDLEADISAVGALRPEHVSWYELDVAEGTVLAERLRGRAASSRVGRPDDDERAAGYRRIVRALTAAGYRWYEVSNFALPGRRARHNVAYWRARPYLGLGAGAVSTVGRRRWATTRDVTAYVGALSGGEAAPARGRGAERRRCGPRAPHAGRSRRAAGPPRRARGGPCPGGAAASRRSWHDLAARWYNPA